MGRVHGFGPTDRLCCRSINSKARKALAVLSLNSNLLSLNAQRRLGEATSSLSQSYNRLSSGLRITKASDDVAGLAVSSLLDVDRKVANQAIRNINDGISYLNVAEGALGELTNIVTRIGELAEQGANGTLGNSQRGALQLEVTALQNEYNRIVNSTKFNGKQIFTGDDTKTILQGGYGTAAQLGIQVGDEAIVGGLNNSAGETIRVSTSSSGVEANGSAGSQSEVSISADGSRIVFDSIATNLVTGDTNASVDIFLKDMNTSQTILISSSSSGVIGNQSSTLSTISADGRYVAFHSTSTNLVTGDTNGLGDVFLKDILTGITTRISVDSNGTQANGLSGDAIGGIAISADGRYVGFGSTSTNLVSGDTNGVGDVFLKDSTTGLLALVSSDINGVQGNGLSVINSISADGRYVLFESDATNLVVGDTNGVRDMFVKDMKTGEIVRASTDSSGAQANALSMYGKISADGKYVAFSSSATNLIANNSGTGTHVFVKNLITGETIKASTTSAGGQVNETARIYNISADGRYVAFESTAFNLVSGDTNVAIDIFVKDLLTGTIELVSANTNGIQGNAFSQSGAMSADGRHIAFESNGTNLVSGDSNGARDIFLRDLSKAGVQEIAGMVVSNQASAKITLDLAKGYLEKISAYKAGIGTGISRATTFISTLQTASENYASASSQITDVDVAEESSRLTSTSILQKAASSVLAQANLQPALALKLLKG